MDLEDMYYSEYEYHQVSPSNFSSSAKCFHSRLKNSPDLCSSERTSLEDKKTSPSDQSKSCRDSGVFEDFQQPLNFEDDSGFPKDKNLLTESADSQNIPDTGSCPQHPEGLSYFYDSDRQLYTSLSSLDSDIESCSSGSFSVYEGSSDDQGESEFEDSSDSESENEEKDERDWSTDTESYISESSSTTQEEEGEDSLVVHSNTIAYRALSSEWDSGDETQHLTDCNRNYSPRFQNLNKLSRSTENINQSFNSVSDLNNWNYISSLSELQQQNVKYFSSSSLSSSRTSLCSDYSSYSEYDNITDVDIRMAETKMKMNDSFLSSVREDFCFQNDKMSYFISPLSYGVNNDFLLDRKIENMNLRDVNTHCLSENSECKGFYKDNVNANPIQGCMIAPTPPSNLPLGFPSSQNNNKSNGSPIVDAYEKECQAVPEKFSLETEKESSEIRKIKENLTEAKMQNELCRESQTVEEHQNVGNKSELKDIEEDPNEDLKELEEAFQNAIKRKEKDALNQPRLSLDFEPLSHRARPSPKQRRKERNALRRCISEVSAKERNKIDEDRPETWEFDVYNIESTLPHIDWDAIEAQLNSSEEDEDWKGMNVNFRALIDNVKVQASNISTNINIGSPIKLIRNATTQNKEYVWANVLDQLYWPFFTPKPVLSKEDEDIIDRFIKVIKEEDDPFTQAPFSNPPLRRRADREEIRRKLAMGTDDDVQNEVNLKKQSLQTRLQNGKNLQICFMNETASDCESQCSDTESTQDKGDDSHILAKESFDKLKANPQTFATERARLQSEARLALAQAKEMARMQMKIEKRCQLKSPISEIVRGSFNKIGFPFPANKRRMSRQLITEMNIAQLQVIVNDLHNEVEKYNEELVQLLLMRDDLHMEQDSMLVDIEDLTNHLSAKENSVGTGKKLYPETSSKIEANSTIKNSFTSKAVKLKSLVKK